MQCRQENAQAMQSAPPASGHIIRGIHPINIMCRDVTAHTGFTKHGIRHRNPPVAHIVVRLPLALGKLCNGGNILGYSLVAGFCISRCSTVQQKPTTVAQEHQKSFYSVQVRDCERSLGHRAFLGVVVRTRQDKNTPTPCCLAQLRRARIWNREISHSGTGLELCRSRFGVSCAEMGLLSLWVWRHFHCVPIVTVETLG